MGLESASHLAAQALRLTTIGNRITPSRSRASAIANRFATMRSRASAIRSRLTTIRSRITTLLSRLTAMQFRNFPDRCGAFPDPAAEFPVRSSRELSGNHLKLRGYLRRFFAKLAKIAPIPCFFPVIREFHDETGSLRTASTARHHVIDIECVPIFLTGRFRPAIPGFSAMLRPAKFPQRLVRAREGRQRLELSLGRRSVVE